MEVVKEDKHVVGVAEEGAEDRYEYDPLWRPLMGTAKEGYQKKSEESQ